MAGTLENIKNELKVAAAILKFKGYIEQAAKDAKLSEEEFVEKKIKKKMEALTKTLPTDQIKALQMYKEAVGPDVWKDIKNNPALPTLVESWAKSVAEKVEPQVIAILKTVLPKNHDLTDAELTMILDKMSDCV